MRKKTGCFWMSMVLTLSLASCASEEEGVYTEDQYYWRRHNMAASENGYYLCQYAVLGEMENYDAQGNLIPTVPGFRMYFYDLASNQVVPLCSRADCTHTDITCDGFFENDSYLQWVNYYNRKVYYVSMDEEYCYLNTMDEAGGSRKKEGTLSTLDALNQEAGLHFHQGYVYYEKAGEQGGLYRRSLKNMKKETCVVPVESGSSRSLHNISMLEGYLYYTIQEEQGGSYRNTFYRMDLDNLEPEELFFADLYLYHTAVTETGDIYYYAQGEGLWKYSAADQSRTLVFEESGLDERSVYYDGKYLYIENMYAVLTYRSDVMEEKREANPEDPDWIGTFQVLDPEGNLIDTIRLETEEREYPYDAGFPIAFYGDDRTMFVDMDQRLLMFDKAQIGQEEAYWTEYDWDATDYDFTVQ